MFTETWQRGTVCKWHVKNSIFLSMQHIRVITMRSRWWHQFLTILYEHPYEVKTPQLAGWTAT